MVKIYFPKDKLSHLRNTDRRSPPDESDPGEHLFFVYVQWSSEHRQIKTYMRTENRKSEIDMVCSGLSDLVSRAGMRLNGKNIKMAVLYRMAPDHDTSENFDVTGVVPTRLYHYLNSDPEKKIWFSQKQIETIVNSTPFTYRALR